MTGILSGLCFTMMSLGDEDPPLSLNSSCRLETGDQITLCNTTTTTTTSEILHRFTLPWEVRGRRGVGGGGGGGGRLSYLITIVIIIIRVSTTSILLSTVPSIPSLPPLSLLDAAAAVVVVPHVLLFHITKTLNGRLQGALATATTRL